MKSASEIAFSPLDIHFARLMLDLSQQSESVALAAKLLSFYCARGHVCLPLELVAGRERLPDGFPDAGIDAPALETWLADLRQSSLVRNAENDFAPLVLDERNRLYLRRYWNYERELIDQIHIRATQRVDVDPAWVGRELNRLFPKSDSEINWQKLAAFTAVTRCFSIISGGPGTGKTRTVAVILALLLQHNPRLRIALCAPTGKAATRLTEAIQNTKAQLGFSPDLVSLIPGEASTIHRLLGFVPDSPYFRHDQQTPLPYDAVIVDEASMVDLGLMAKLFAAVKSSARIILLGDKDQLASVESGAVLGDICNNGRAIGIAADLITQFESATGDKVNTPTSPSAGLLAGNIVQLQKNYRFGEESGIYRISRLVNEGEADKALALLKSETASDLVLKRLPRPSEIKQHLKEIVLSGYRACLECKTPAEALAHVGSFRILCCLRDGPYGVTELNRIAEEILAEAGLIRPNRDWYTGRPIMVTRNDYSLKLFNGDIGVLFPDPETGEMRAWFLSAEGTIRRILPFRLPAHETVFAMTVHKSQGSEFNRLLMVLPERDNPVLTRELVYTGVTRARQHVELWANESVCRNAIAKTIKRDSGLRDALWGVSATAPSVDRLPAEQTAQPVKTRKPAKRGSDDDQIPFDF